MQRGKNVIVGHINSFLLTYLLICMWRGNATSSRSTFVESDSGQVVQTRAAITKEYNLTCSAAGKLIADLEKT